MTYRAPQDDKIPGQPADGDAVGVYDRPERTQARGGSMMPLLTIAAIIVILAILALVFLI